VPTASHTSHTRTSRPSQGPRRPRARPLIARPGARFECTGDGLCCSDIHALGPVTLSERKELDLIAPKSLIRHPDLNEWVFDTQPGGELAGQCVHRSKRGCELHAKHGAEAKPGGCMRFPFGLISTPDGGRITTEHRCPCRTLGDRPLIEPEDKAPIEPDHVYLAPSDYHMLVDHRTLSLSVDPPLRYSRPSIDILFESVAEAYGRGALGIVLTGSNEDGAVGAAAIKHAGGRVLVQDPKSAQSPVAPLAVLAETIVDAVLPLERIAGALRKLVLSSDPALSGP